MRQVYSKKIMLSQKKKDGLAKKKCARKKSACFLFLSILITHGIGIYGSKRKIKARRGRSKGKKKKEGKRMFLAPLHFSTLYDPNLLIR